MPLPPRSDIVRHNFGRIEEVVALPGLIELQKKSYGDFLQMDVAPGKRENRDLQAIFNAVFPIKNFSDTVQLEFISYRLADAKYSIHDCLEKDLDYESGLYALLRLTCLKEGETKPQVSEQEIYLGNVPLMSPAGTFIINGTERVVVSQMHRSPGISFSSELDETSGKQVLAARVVPYRGSWLDFIIMPRGIIYVRIDMKRRIHMTTLLQAMGMAQSEILNEFYNTITCRRHSKGGWVAPLEIEEMLGNVLQFDLYSGDKAHLILKKGAKVTSETINKVKELGIKERWICDDQLIGSYLAQDVIDLQNGLVFLEAASELKQDHLDQFAAMAVNEVHIIHVLSGNTVIRDTVASDKNSTQDDALAEIYQVVRPGEVPTPEIARKVFENIFSNPTFYSLLEVGRIKINRKLGLDQPLEMHTLSKLDIIAIVRELVNGSTSQFKPDDIDSLSNRRVRSVGELLGNVYYNSFLQMERNCRERLNSVEVDYTFIPGLVNFRPIVSGVREFFRSSQLSQFMDQTNPLSEIAHKRRLSALGPGGFTRERVSFEVRDVHPTHYGRICPIETPEGQNIGLISSLASYAKIDDYGFIQSPYRKVVEGKITKEIKYLTAEEEATAIIAQADEVDKHNNFKHETAAVRCGTDFRVAAVHEVGYVDVSPKQVFSIAATLIPFLENDDANRALMGANMQRQAVPLIRPRAGIIGTGMEKVVACDSGAVIVARRPGIVEYVDAQRVVVKVELGSDDSESNVDIYKLLKMKRSNQNTCINQIPIVHKGDKVLAGDVIADGASTESGELSLGQDVLVAFMPWMGYNFEDAILLSKRLVKDDIFTSIHIEEFEVAARDTKLGPEEITRDLPNVSEQNIRELDESGIIRIGAKVKTGDILVGKVTPRGEIQSTPEEKLLRAIFGEKSSVVKDSSLRLPPGFYGTVIDVVVLNLYGTEKNERAKQISEETIAQCERDVLEEKRIREEDVYNSLKQLLVDQELTANGAAGKVGETITADKLAQIPCESWWDLEVANQDKISELHTYFKKVTGALTEQLEDRKTKESQGDDLPPGVIQVVKVFVAVQRKIRVGDKLAGRHGNKGVISKIMLEEDMPYLEDGTPVDIVLNPLGVPSRMNVGQILETHLGWAAYNLGRIAEAIAKDDLPLEEKAARLRKYLATVYNKEEMVKINAKSDKELIKFALSLGRGVPVATPVFDGAKEQDIVNMFNKSGVDTSGQVRLRDGRNGELFDRETTVGIINMMKLHHLADEKIHARSIGTYSLVTQQPLGGKAQFGGQRFGEMEVWALEAYGAAYTLQEILTVKSDDVQGRVKVYNAIVTEDYNFSPGVPESFNVLINELRSLCMNVELKE